tara:strand:+ start:6393 stop:6557 length:165 start_codon:yes stop_codon:yes gene_type:complete
MNFLSKTALILFPFVLAYLGFIYIGKGQILASVIVLIMAFIASITNITLIDKFK